MHICTTEFSCISKIHSQRFFFCSNYMYTYTITIIFQRKKNHQHFMHAYLVQHRTAIVEPSEWWAQKITCVCLNGSLQTKTNRYFRWSKKGEYAVEKRICSLLGCLRVEERYSFPSIAAETLNIYPSLGFNQCAHSMVCVSEIVSFMCRRLDYGYVNCYSWVKMW